MTRDLAVIVSLSLLVSFLGLGRLPVSRTQEARIAVSAREMLTDGHWLIPTLNGHIRVQKPPLMTWLTAGSYRLCGEIGEFSARLPAYLFSLTSALLLYGLGRRLFGRAAGLLAAVVLLTSFEFVRHSRLAETDIALLTAVTAAMGSWWLADAQPQRGRRYMAAGWLACALAVNIKGPAGLALPVLSYAVWLGMRRDGAAARRWLHPCGWPPALLLSGLWYAYVVWQAGDAATTIFGKELDDTFVTGADHPNPVYYYLYIPFRCFAPWTLFLYAAVAALLRRPEKRTEERFVLVWLGVTLALLSFNPNKQPHYALLLLPPMVLALGAWAERLRRAPRAARWVNGVTAALAAGVAVASPAYAFRLHEHVAPETAFAPQLAREMRRLGLERAEVYFYRFTHAPLLFYWGRNIPVVNADHQLEQDTPFYLIVRGEAVRTVTDGTPVLTLHKKVNEPYVIKRFAPPLPSIPSVMRGSGRPD